MKKLLIITPHLSTGGAPQVTVNKVELLRDHFEIKVVEYSFLAWSFVVQRLKIIDMLTEGVNFHSLREDKFSELVHIMCSFSPDVVVMEEFPEMFMDDKITAFIYSETRTWKISETTHDSSFNPKHKKWMPDSFVFVALITYLSMYI